MNTLTPAILVLFMFFSFSFIGATGHKIGEAMASKNSKRKIIQIAANANYVYALCDDNTTWRSYTGTGGWELV
jgi:hypothetical protein